MSLGKPKGSALRWAGERLAISEQTRAEAGIPK